MTSQYSNLTIAQYLKDNPLSSTDRQGRIEELTQRIQKQDEDAKAALILESMSFVVSLAKEIGGEHLPIEDKISCGKIGLVKAVNNIENYDSSKASFLAFAKNSVMRDIYSGLNGNKTIRLPDHQQEKISLLKKIEEGITQEKMGSVSDEEIAQEIGLSCAEIRGIRASGFPVSSLDAPAGADADSSPLIDLIADPNAMDPSEVIDTINPQTYVKTLLSKLPDDLSEVAERRFGIDREKETLKEIAKTSKHTAENVRLQGIKAINLMGKIAKNDLACFSTK